VLHFSRAWAWRAIAIVVALGTALVVSGDLRSLHARAHDLGAPGAVVVARRDLVLGHRIVASDITTVVRYRSQVPTGALRAVDQVVDHVVTLSVASGGTLSARNLASGSGGYGVVLTVDTRVVRVPDVQALDPAEGAVVDVLATYRDSSSGTEPSSGGLATVVASGAIVVEGDRSSTTTRDDANGTTTERAADLGVTLLIRRPDALRIASALANGQVILVLAPPEDACCSTH
jgi:Flp pilus assembly protein CpaB